MATTTPASECANNGASGGHLSAGPADDAPLPAENDVTVTPLPANLAAKTPLPAEEGGAKGVVIVLCTTPDKSTAQALAELLLGGKLAACVTLLPGATSLYVWEGKLEQQEEVQMLIKSHVRLQQELMALIMAHHPYQTPELLILPVQGGSPDYLSWLNASLS